MFFAILIVGSLVLTIATLYIADRMTLSLDEQTVEAHKNFGRAIGGDK